ncbi:(E)-4-hydroxy-3-methylbut-2-enyl-diphosphate synthase [Candidatus Hakubella thermalkaliphila]|uniref:4-hydroxy-3-methylbut-2-en-1-yl diphosphate synthase (flavodoxin) n=3 Tax=Candidatus Hakubella thermalkaliphila TaxID=2754717 RepID=A0A6V8PS32_9ACTN|nr:(E)-4-hydroxy-3-methylbut-2-enyl-diphosphate synthase [Candidatus Hakubella thermalkaliphila]
MKKMEIQRRKTKKIYIGSVPIGGDAPLTVQSMTKTRTSDADATISQINDLYQADCQIVRVGVPDHASAAVLKRIVKASPLPIVADIHFSYRLALAALEAGVHGVRINPGNIGSKENIRKIVQAALARGVPIRIGVNAGSLEKDLLEKYGRPTPEALVESALREVRTLEDLGFYDIEISVKASSVLETVEANRLLASRTEYPLHLGVTEAGSGLAGIIKSAVGIGTLLIEGIGDTIRVSLTGDPVEEVTVAREILKSLGLLKEGINIISCPTCARCQVDLLSIVQEFSERTRDVKSPLDVAIMGCVVNGPGEAREAEMGVALGRTNGLFFQKGEEKGRIPLAKLLDLLVEEVRKADREKQLAETHKT